MRRRTMLYRLLLVCALLAVPLAETTVAHAQSNTQEGDNRSNTDQSGDATSGDSVAGQVAGVVSSGAASVDATNSTDRADATSGDARGSNSADTIVGENTTTGCGSLTADVCPLADLIVTLPVDNAQEGDNTANIDQTASTISGSAVAGEIVGVVTSAGGSADVVLANSTTSSDVDTGDGRFSNNSTLFVGGDRSGGPCCVLPTDVIGRIATPSLQA